MTSQFQPDYRHVVAAVQNRRPARLPLYEHSISLVVAGKMLDRPLPQMLQGSDADLRELYRLLIGFYRSMTYDTFFFELPITNILPDHGAVYGGRPGPIQNRKDFEAYPWEQLGELFWAVADRRLQAISPALPDGMKLVGGCGNGPLHIMEDLVGYEPLCYMLLDDPQLVADLCRRVGELMLELWSGMLQRYGDLFAVCRFGDDMGHKTGTLLSPQTLRQYFLPQYSPIIDLVHSAGKPFLLHSCGNIFEVMPDVIELGIDAKHSNEDAIAPFEQWIDRYGSRIGLAGGIDVDILTRRSSEEVYGYVLEKGQQYRRQAKGYMLGSGNSIPDYVPPENFEAMVRAAQEIRRLEGSE